MRCTICLLNHYCLKFAILAIGRVLQLIEAGTLEIKSVRLLVLDEADKLLEKNFAEQIK